MATILPVGLLLLSCVALLSQAGNGSSVLSTTNQAMMGSRPIEQSKCGAGGETVLCRSKLSKGPNLPLNGDDTTVKGYTTYTAGYRTNTETTEWIYHGFTATMDVYALSLSPGQLGSYGLVWAQTYKDDDQTTVLDGFQIGWGVTSGNEQPFVYLGCTASGHGSSTANASEEHKSCPGFRPEEGALVHPFQYIPGASQPDGGTKQYIKLVALKDNDSGDWLLYYGINRDPELIGRISKSFFTSLSEEAATNVVFGGITVVNDTFLPTPDLPPMGSGYIDDEDNEAASMSDIEVLDVDGRGWLPKYVYAFSNDDGYAVTALEGGKFFYGGPVVRPLISSAVATSCVHVAICSVFSLLVLLLFFNN